MEISNICCFRFEDRRGTAYLERQRCIYESKQQRTYNKDPDSTIRAKMVALSLLQPVSGVGFQLPYHLFDLFSGGWVSRGLYRAELASRKEAFDLKKAYKSASFSHKFKYVFIELVKKITTIAFFAIAIVAREIAAIIGIFNPLLGRALYSNIERFIRVDQFGREDKKLRSFIMLHYSAPCMVAKEDLKEQNLFRMDDDYKSGGIYARAYRIHRLIRDYGFYFFKKEEIVVKMQEMFEAIQGLKFTPAQEAADSYNLTGINFSEDQKTFLSFEKDLKAAIKEKAENPTQDCDFKQKLDQAVKILKSHG